MSLSDRDYMKSGFESRDKKASRPSIYKRVVFFFWMLFRRAAHRKRQNP